jgi:hypothetical protein
MDGTENTMPLLLLAAHCLVTAIVVAYFVVVVHQWVYMPQYNNNNNNNSVEVLSICSLRTHHALITIYHLHMNAINVQLK